MIAAHLAQVLPEFGGWAAVTAMEGIAGYSAAWAKIENGKQKRP